MSLADLIADDFDLFDGIETVTVQRRSLSGSITTVANVTALKQETTGAVVSLGPNAQTSTDVAKWQIKASTLPGGMPRRGDRILSTTYGTWEVLNANVRTLGTRYVATCKQITP